MSCTVLFQQDLFAQRSQDTEVNSTLSLFSVTVGYQGQGTEANMGVVLLGAEEGGVVMGEGGCRCPYVVGMEG